MFFKRQFLDCKIIGDFGLENVFFEIYFDYVLLKLKQCC